jgi:hypothetical protein
MVTVIIIIIYTTTVILNKFICVRRLIFRIVTYRRKRNTRPYVQIVYASCIIYYYMHYFICLRKRVAPEKDSEAFN